MYRKITKEQCNVFFSSFFDFFIRCLQNNFILFSIIFCLSVLKALSWIIYFPQGDEAIVLAGGMRLMEGMLPYEDFFSFWPIGSQLAAAGIFKIFGYKYGYIRFAALLLEVTKTFVVALTLRPIIKEKKMIFAYLAAVLWFINNPTHEFSLSHKLFSQAFGIFSFYWAIQFFEKKQFRYAYLGGIFVGLSALCTQSEGAAFFLFWIMAFVLHKSEIKILKKISFFLSGVITIWFFFLVYVIGHNLLSDFIYQVIVFPTGGYMTQHTDILSQYLRLLPFSIRTQTVSQSWVPLVLAGIFFGILYKLTKEKEFTFVAFKLPIVFFLFALSFQLAVYYNGLHSLSIGFLIASGAYFIYKLNEKRGAMLMAANVVFLLILAIYCGSIWKSWRSSPFFLYRFDRTPGQIVFTRSPEELEALNFLHQYLSKSWVVIGYLPDLYVLQGIVPQTYLDIHVAGGYTSSDQFDRELQVIGTISPEYLFVDNTGFDLFSGNKEDKDFIERVLNNYVEIDRYVSPSGPIQGMPLSRIAVYKKR